METPLYRRLKAILELPGPFASVLVDVSLDAADGEQQLGISAKDAADGLQEMGAPSHTADLVAETIATPVFEPAPQSRFIIASENAILLNEVIPERTWTRVVDWGPLPDLETVLEIESRSVEFILVEVDHEGGQVSTYRGDSRRIEGTESTGFDSRRVHKRREGGLAHMRYQRTNAEGWRNRAQEVADIAADKAGSEYPLVIIAGSTESRPQVVDMLTKFDRAEVIELERAARNADRGDEEMDTDIDGVVHDYIQRRHDELMRRLEERIGQGMYATSGVEDVMHALAQAKAEMLLLDWQHAREQTVTLDGSEGIALPQLAGDEKQLRADLLLVAMAISTDARVTPVRDGELGDDAAGALLRWE